MSREIVIWKGRDFFGVEYRAVFVQGVGVVAQEKTGTRWTKAANPSGELFIYQHALSALALKFGLVEPMQKVLTTRASTATAPKKRGRPRKDAAKSGRASRNSKVDNPNCEVAQ